MRDGRIDRVLGDITLYAVIIVPGSILGQRASLDLHFVRGLPGARNNLTHSPHRLRVAADHPENAKIVQNVFGSYAFWAAAASGPCPVFGHAGIEMWPDHH